MDAEALEGVQKVVNQELLCMAAKAVRMEVMGIAETAQAALLL